MRQIGLICALSAFWCAQCGAPRIYTNSWAMRLTRAPDRVAQKYGFLNLGKIFADGDYYHMKHKGGPKRSLQPQHFHKVRLKRETEVLWSAQQTMLVRKKRDQFPQPNDPSFSLQWHLSNAFGLQVMSAWTMGYSGKGVVVTIIDDGIEINHPDLKANYDPEASYDFNDNDPNPQPRYSGSNKNSHGTRCAGEVAAVANNRVCGAGVAFRARIGGIRLLDGDITDLMEAKSLNLKLQHIDIYSSSWGPKDDGKRVEGPSVLAQAALVRGISQGRRGLGSIYIWASGNGGNKLDNCNLDGYANSIYTLSVSSTTEHGTVPYYSEPCTATLTTTYSGGSRQHRKIVTTDLLHDCTAGHSGTSASAPLAAGIVALALEANPLLSWRDVQHIVVRASRRLNLKTDDWKKNGVGRDVSHFYGYGLLHAGRMVDLARKWKAVRPQRKCTSAVTSKPIDLSASVALKWNETACLGMENWIHSLEHVQARLTLKHPRRGHLSITLISPMGTSSRLVTMRPLDVSHNGFSNWAFMSTHSWDEDPRGLWTLLIEDKGGVKNKGVILHFQLEMFGTEEHMIGRRMERVKVHLCAAWSSDGYCTECEHPYYVYENKCLLTCPPHYYNWSTNSTRSIRLCLPCHPSCNTCYNQDHTNCLDCPPSYTFQPALGTCIPPVTSRWWQDHAVLLKGAMILGVVLGMPVLVLSLVRAATILLHSHWTERNQAWRG